MTINKNQKDIALALAGMVNNHTALASLQLQNGAVDSSVQAMQLEMAMKDTLMAQDVLMQLLEANGVTEKPAPSVPVAQAPVVETAPKVFPVKELSKSPSAATSKTLPAQPVTEDVVEDLVAKSYREEYNLTLRVEKPCMSCPFASTCEVRSKATIIENCGISDVKAQAMAGGKIAIDVVVDETAMTVSYIAYKDGEYISHVALNKDTKPIISILEDYMGKRVFLDVQPNPKKAMQPNSIFSLMTAKIIGHEPLNAPKETGSTFSKEDVQVIPVFSI